MKLLFAPDSFKGSATSVHIIDLLTQTAERCFEGCEIVGVPMADGGEGTLDVLVNVMKGRCKKCKVSGPLWEQTEARFGVIEDSTVVIETAEACGLTLIPHEKRNPCLTTSYGAGELIRYVLKQGYKNILLSVGGSATNDGGIGAAEALGVRFFDEHGHRIEPVGENLCRIEVMETADLLPELKEAKITIMSDVQNPLLGKNGATYIYGPQKGGNRNQLDFLEAGMSHYAKVIKRQFAQDITKIKGIGAAGGLGIPFLIFGNAKLQSGIQTVLDIIRFDDLLEGVDFVVTGEGRVDCQSAYGKVLSGVGKACKEKGIPAAAITGCMGEGAFDIFDCGIDSIIPAINNVMDMETAMKNTDQLVMDAAERMFRFIKMGMKIQERGGRLCDERTMGTAAWNCGTEEKYGT